MKTETGRMDKQQQYETAKLFLILKHREKQYQTSFWDFFFFLLIESQSLKLHLLLEDLICLLFEAGDLIIRKCCIILVHSYCCGPKDGMQMGWMRTAHPAQGMGSRYPEQLHLQDPWGGPGQASEAENVVARSCFVLVSILAFPVRKSQR